MCVFNSNVPVDSIGVEMSFQYFPEKLLLNPCLLSEIEACAHLKQTLSTESEFAEDACHA